MFDENPEWIRALVHREDTFSELETYVKGVKAIVEGVGRSHLADRNENRDPSRSCCGKDYLLGQVVYIDSYGNAITNISKTLLKKLEKEEGSTFFCKGHIHV